MVNRNYTSQKKDKVDMRPVMEEEETPSWVMDVNNLINEGQKLDAGRSWTIYKVPDNLCEVKKSAFVPKLVSIGPFHYKDSKLHAMEAHKIRFLVRLFRGSLNLIEQDDGKLSHSDAMQLEDVTKAMKLREQKARDCYSESFNIIPSDEFVRMMVVDGCFVVELLRIFYKIRMGKDVGADEPIFASGWMVRTLQRDLLMLENQLPYFVLDELFKLTNKDRRHKAKPSLAELALTFFHRFLPRYEITPLLSKEHNYDHLLDLLRSCFLSNRRRHERSEWRIYHHSDWGLDRSPTRCENNSQLCTSVVGLIFSAFRVGGAETREERSTLVIPQVHYKNLINPVEELLKNGGINIQKHKGLDLLDIRFSEGVLKIPRLVIDDDTIPLLFNFVALEQCNLVAVNPFFISFFVFLDSLVCSASDVETLCKRRVINHSLENNQVVATLINKLGREMVYDESKFYFHAQVTLINEHYKAYLSSRWSQYRRKWHGWWRKLIKDYFSNPWSIISLLAAVVLLILTSVQTFYTIYGFYKPI